MNHFKTVGGLATASCILMSAPAAWADVTAEQVWDGWKDYMQSFGYSITAEENASSDSLKVSDMVLSVPIPEEETTVDITFSEMSFTENGDGTVAITMLENTPVTIHVAASGEDAEDVTVTLDYINRGLDMTASGDAENMTYDYAIDSTVIELVDLVVDGKAMDVGTGRFEATDLAGTVEMRSGTLHTTQQKATSGPITYALDFKHPDGENGHLKLNGDAESMSYEAVTEVPNDMDLNDMAAAMQAGFAVEGSYQIGPSKMDFNFADSEDSAQGQTSSDGSEFMIDMNKENIRYAASSSNIAIEFAGSEIPFPISLKMSELGFDLLTPLSETEEPQEAALKLNLRELTVSDMIWSLFDPSEQLPRDPATIVLDMSGKLKLLVNLLDPQQMEAMDDEDAMPGELHSATLNELTISAVGAELTGEGDVDFDNSDMSSYSGMPKPVGAVNLQLVGGNGLLDKLIEMGFVSQENATGARMMMGLFAVPGNGEDTLTSEITFTDEGHVLANGQRLK